MAQYLDIHLRPDPEFTSSVLMGALFSKLHRILVELRVNDLGISFPEYKLHPKGLGERLRLHAEEPRLEEFMLNDWLKGMCDHVRLSGVQAVPLTTRHVVVRRRQFKTSVERLRRRRMKRKSESYEQSASAIPVSIERNPRLPFVNVRSQSTGQYFSLFIEQGTPRDEPIKGSFNRYGLSAGATVPWF